MPACQPKLGEEASHSPWDELLEDNPRHDPSNHSHDTARRHTWHAGHSQPPANTALPSGATLQLLQASCTSMSACCGTGASTCLGCPSGSTQPLLGSCICPATLPNLHEPKAATHMPMATGFRLPVSCSARPMSAPRGSAAPLSAAQPMAFHLLPVAKKIGTPKAMPSAQHTSSEVGGGNWYADTQLERLGWAAHRLSVTVGQGCLVIVCG